MRGNIENPIGSVQMPLGVAGPLLRQRRARATARSTCRWRRPKGALVRSYERGMVMLTRAGGVDVTRDSSTTTSSRPMFSFDTVGEAAALRHRTARPLRRAPRRSRIDDAPRQAAAGRRRGPSGRAVIVSFYYSTADAQGMNMIVKATERACAVAGRGSGTRRASSVFSGMSSEKRASGFLLARRQGQDGRRRRAHSRRRAAVLHAGDAAADRRGVARHDASATSRRTRSASTRTTPTAWRRSSSPAARTSRTSPTPRSASPITN